MLISLDWLKQYVDIKEDISNVKFQQKIIAESLISW
jgi:hypothetical protein